MEIMSTEAAKLEVLRRADKYAIRTLRVPMTLWRAAAIKANAEEMSATDWILAALSRAVQDE